MANTTETFTRQGPTPDEGDDDLQILNRLWENGYLKRHLNSLERFYREKRPEFLSLIACEPPNNHLLVELAKQLVIENGIVDHLAETLDQIKAIESEIWIQGENGNHDRERIAAEWTDRHAASWREWRIKEYLYTTERMESQLRDCLQNAS